MTPADASLYYAMLERHGGYNDEAENVQRVFSGKAIRRPIAAVQAEIIVDPDIANVTLPV